MSVEITIKQKGFFKKPLPLEVILGNNLKYGAYDGLRLAHDEMGNGEFVAYNPQHIARGFSVQWQEDEKQQIYMRLPFPTCEEEVDDFFDTVERINSFWKKADIQIDGNPTTMDEINRGRQSMKQFNFGLLKMYSNGKFEGENHQLFCAFWPISLGKTEKKRFLASKSLDDFRDYLHEMQSIDAYYAKPSFYKGRGEVFGMYVFTEETRSIFPNKGYVPFGVNEPGSNKSIKVDNFYVTLHSITKDTSLGTVRYDDFMNSLDEDDFEYYDSQNKIINPLGYDKLKSIVEKYRVDI